jgi:hypothetical protein
MNEGYYDATLQEQTKFRSLWTLSGKTKKPFVSLPRFTTQKDVRRSAPTCHLFRAPGSVQYCPFQNSFQSIREKVYENGRRGGPQPTAVYVCTVMYAPDCNTVTRNGHREMGTGAVIQSGPFPFQSMGVRCNQGGACAHSYQEGAARDVAPLRSHVSGSDKWKKDSYSPRTRAPVCKPPNVIILARDHLPGAARNPILILPPPLRLLISAFPAIGGHLLMMGTGSDAVSRTWSLLARRGTGGSNRCS